MRRTLLILGPTASGKSALALSLAEQTGAIIINADSMQVYRDLAILTARPTPEDLSRARHDLYGFVDGDDRYSTGRWLADAAAVINAARTDARPVIVVGGTGLYFKALTEGLAETPPIPTDVQSALLADLSERGAPALHARLASIDPEGAQLLSPLDGPRLTRALAVWEATGRPLRAWHAEQGPAFLPRDEWLGIVLHPERAWLYKTIAARFAAMLAKGALGEAQKLIDRRLDPTLPLMKAHGLPWLARHLAGEMTLEEAAVLGVRDTRRYAKRQFTWMAGQAAHWARLQSDCPQTRVATALSWWRVG